MSPRPYHLGKRQDQIARGRDQVVGAARALLAGADSYTAFTVEAVARQADVSRATVYYQFKSKTGLLEALCDALAADGQLSALAAAFAEPDPVAALRGLITAFAQFWAADRLVTRRLRALAALDPDVAEVIAARDQRRLDGVAVIAARLGDAGLLAVGPDRTARVLFTLTSFETFDTLAAPDQPLTSVAPEVFGLARAALHDPAP
ncbi:MAG: TetR/AcrR family transcriptional regulator [Streptosporangiaceae bacterium]